MTPPRASITCVNMTPLLCQEGLKQDLTQPNPMISSIQTLASFGLKGHFTLYSKVFSYSAPFGSMQGHTLPIAPAMRHFTERTNSSSTGRSSDMNTMLSLSSLPAKRYKMYSVGVLACATQDGEGVLSHVRKARACGLPDGALSGELHTDQDIDGRVLTCAVRANDRQTHVRFTSTIVGLPSTGLGSGKANFIVSLLSSKYAFLTRYFYANMVRVLPFASLEAFSLLIRVELDAHLVVVTHKAPREVQHRRLLHVLIKVMEGVLSHVPKAKACDLVAQHEVRLLLHRPAPLISPQRQRQHLNKKTSDSAQPHGKHKSRTSCSASTKPTSGRSSFKPYNCTAPRNSRLDVKHSATQPTGSHDILVCSSLACNLSRDQTNTTGLDNNVPHIKEPDRRENVWHKRTLVRAHANPNQISTQHMTYASHCPERATAQSLSIPFCRPRNIDARPRINVDS